MAEKKTVQAARWSRHFGRTSIFKDNNTPSGVTGSRANVVIGLDNFPDALIAVRVTFSYAIPAAYLLANPMAAVGFDQIVDQCNIDVAFAQQNLTDENVHLRTFQGPPSGLKFYPLPVPQMMRGANQVKVRLVRLMDMPVIDDVSIVPTAHITVVGVSLQSDFAPAGTPGSSGA